MYRYVFFLVFLLLVISNLAGCTTRLSGASSLQVDVEVYKGPLSEEPIIQASELAGLLSEFQDQLTNFKNGIDTNSILSGLCPKNEINTISCQEFIQVVNETRAMLMDNTKRDSTNPKVLSPVNSEKVTDKLESLVESTGVLLGGKSSCITGRFTGYRRRT